MKNSIRKFNFYNLPLRVYELEEKIKNLIFPAKLTNDEIQDVDSNIVGLTTGELNKTAFDSYIRGGVASFNGDNMTEIFNIPHGLGQNPRFHVCNRNADGSEQAALFTSMADETNITISFLMPPSVGVTVMINWMVSK